MKPRKYEQARCPKCGSADLAYDHIVEVIKTYRQAEDGVFSMNSSNFKRDTKETSHVVRIYCANKKCNLDLSGNEELKSAIKREW